MTAGDADAKEERLRRTPGKPKVVVVGGINMDIIAAAERMPNPGETIGGSELYTAPGGKGGNQAVAAARMGADVRMVGRVGRDVFGPMLLDSLEESGVDVRWVSVDPDSSSGIAVILLDSDRENYIVQVYGANRTGEDAVGEAAVEALEDADALMLQMETPLRASMGAARAAKERGAAVVWDPAPPTPLPREIYDVVDVLTPNQTEAEYLTGAPVTDVESARRAAGALAQADAPAVVVKLGELGAYYVSGEREGHVSPLEVEQVDTVAAGDAFAGALTVAIAEGMELETAVRYGCAAGALAVTKRGAQDAMPTRAEVEALLQQPGGA
jgi:ribokinase